MIALHRSFFAAAALSLPLAIGTPTAHAGPALSELSDVADYNQDDCAQRARCCEGGRVYRFLDM